MTHTPGPWETKPSKRFPDIYIIGNGQTLAATYGEMHYPTQAANARLIAAAPDLVKALDDLVTVFIGSFGDTPVMQQAAEGFPAVQNARAAIAKATGEHG